VVFLCGMGSYRGRGWILTFDWEADAWFLISCEKEPWEHVILFGLMGGERQVILWGPLEKTKGKNQHGTDISEKISRKGAGTYRGTLGAGSLFLESGQLGEKTQAINHWNQKRKPEGVKRDNMLDG